MDAFAARAPSKLHDLRPVPTTAPTDKTVERDPPPYGAIAHVTAVNDVHDVLLHATANTIDAVGSFDLKFSPKITENPPDGAMLDGLVPVVTGAADTKRRAALLSVRRATFGAFCRQSVAHRRS
jgi:hypothetical protein